MFTAGIVPGILMGVALVIVVLLEAKKHNIQPTQKKATAKERWDAFKDAFWGFLMPVIILGGIYGSVFTPTEAAAVSVVYGLFVGIFIYKEIKIKDLWDLMVDSAKTTGGIMLIVASASLFSFVCTKFGIAQAASDLLGSVAHNQFTFLLIVNIIFLIAGCFIDANSAMYIFIPIMLPVCKALGYDLVAFGIVATVNLAIGQVTPPVGVNLFVAISVKLKKGIGSYHSSRFPKLLCHDRGIGSGSASDYVCSADFHVPSKSAGKRRSLYRNRSSSNELRHSRQRWCG